MEGFMKYPKIKLIGHDDNKELLLDPEDEIVIEEKIDGCFNYNMKIHTNKGMIPIGKIVNNKLDVKVLSINSTNNELSYQNITQYYKYKSSNNWVKIIYDYFGKKRYIIVTNNHYIFTNNGLKQIKDINISNDTLIPDKLSPGIDSQSIIIGSILGDMSFRNMNHGTKNPMFSETHSVKQEDYLKWKRDNLKQFISNEDYHSSRYDSNHKVTRKYRITSISSPTFKQFNFLYRDGKKKIPKDIYKYLNPLSIAVWYMDDGSCSFTKKQRPRAKFHTQSFSREEVKYLRNALEEYGITSTQHNYSGWQIDVTSEGTKELFKLIYPYIIKSMKYKLPQLYKNLISKYSLQKYKFIHNCKILSIKIYNPKIKVRYDIEVETNHNYFVKGILVHNSNFRFMYHDGKFIWGSRTRELGEPSQDNKSWARCIGYITRLMKKGDYNNFIFYGENCIRHSTPYDFETMPPFLGFDIYDLDKHEFLDWKDAKRFYEDIDLHFVPVLWHGKVKELDKWLQLL